MSKAVLIVCLAAGLVTWAGTLAEKCERYHAVQQAQGVLLDCGRVTVSEAAWNTATDIVETVWRNHTNRQAKVQQARAANVQRLQGVNRVREIRRARNEALKGGGK